jgi:hypothetical protein
MARYIEPTETQQAGWRQWVAERPHAVRVIAERFDPWTLYRLKTTDQRVTLLSISENGTVSVAVSGEFNFVTHERRVFGINPDDLEPCDLPASDTRVGTLLTHDEVEEHIDALRVIVRPDLWELNADGKAVRKTQAKKHDQ